MKWITLIVVAATLAAAGLAPGTLQAQEGQEQRAEQHPSAFLQKLVGEWSVTTYAVMDPDQDPYRFEGRETGRMLGRQWFVSEFYSEVEGVVIESILTIGYDPAKEKFVASYANSNQPMLWTYEGTLNDEGTKLTLKTEGPFMGDPDQTAEYRVVIERKDADHWTMGSQIQVPDEEEWFEFLSFVYEREKGDEATE